MSALSLPARKIGLVSLAILVSLGCFSSDSRAMNLSAYLTFYGFDDNDDGNPRHLGTNVISDAVIHSYANEDLGTFDQPGTMAADKHFLSPGTKVYVPSVQRYYVVEDTCAECTRDWRRKRPHIDLFVSGSGEKLAECEDRLTMEVAKIIVNPPRDLPVKQGSVCDEGAP
jgi:3D (Asp-Asp-Asp) domain-containing protein